MNKTEQVIKEEFKLFFEYLNKDDSSQIPFCKECEKLGVLQESFENLFHTYWQQRCCVYLISSGKNKGQNCGKTNCKKHKVSQEEILDSFTKLKASKWTTKSNALVKLTNAFLLLVAT